jgi:uncharacterized coiled-coil protein SlyX
LEERIAALQVQANDHERAIGELKGEVKAIPNLQAAVDRLTEAMNSANGMLKMLQIMGAIVSGGAALIGYIMGKKQ